MECSWFVHHSHHESYRCPFGAVACDTKIMLQAEITDPGFVGSVILMLRREGCQGEPLSMNLCQEKDGKKVFRAEIDAPPDPGWLWYYFIKEKEGKTFYYGNNRERLGGKGELWDGCHPPEYQITVYKEGTPPPPWFQEAIIYQIFVDRFYPGSPGQILHMKKGCYIHESWDETPVYFQHPYTGKYIFDFLEAAFWE